MKIKVEIDLELNLDRNEKVLYHERTKDGVDVIVCWRHNWKKCPKEIEVIELSSLVNGLEKIHKEIAGDTKKLNAYQEFCRNKRLEGFPFRDIANMWQAGAKSDAEKRSRDIRDAIGKATKKATPKPLTSYQEFARQMRREGKTLREIGDLWRARKGG